MGKVIIDQLFEDADGDPLELTVSEREKPKQKVWRRHYTTVPDAWKQQLQNAKRTSTYRLAIELLYLHWKTGGRPVVVSDKVATAAGVSPRSKFNALAELKRLGLVRVEQEPGKAPRVTPLHTKIGK